MGVANVSQAVASELLALASFYGIDDGFGEVIAGLDLDDYVEIVLGERNLELVVGGMGKEEALVRLAREQGFPPEVVGAFEAFGARFPGRMLYTKLCFGAGKSPPSMYFVAIEPWEGVLPFLATLPSIADALPRLRAELGASAICFLIGFTLDPRTGALLVKTYHLFDRHNAASDPKPFLISQRLSEGRLLPANKQYWVNLPWASLAVSPRWAQIVERARSLFGDEHTLMRGETVGGSGHDGMKIYVFRHDRRQSDTFQLRSYNYYLDEGIRLLQVDRRQPALAAFANAVDFAPNDPPTLQRVATFELSLGQHTTGIEHALRARALMQARSPGPDAAALERLTQELRAAPTVAAHINRGALLFSAGRAKEALDDFERAAALDPACAEAHNAIGGACLRLGRYREALEACTRAHELSPRTDGSNLAVATNIARVSARLDAQPSREGYNERGLLLYQVGALDDARADFLAAEQQPPRGGGSPATRGGGSPATRGGDSPATRGGDSPATRGGDSPATRGGDSPTRERSDARPGAPRAKKYLFIPMSSHGYVFSAIKLAHLLQERSESVLFATSTDYGALLEIYGIDCVRLYNQQSNQPFMTPASWFSAETVVNDVAALEQVIDRYRPDVLVATPLSLAAFILGERHSIPIVVIGFSEYLFPSPGAVDPEKQWRIDEMAKHYNRCRAALGLPPVGTSITEFPLIGDQYLIRSIPQLDDGLELPPQVAYAGGLYWEPDYANRPLEGFVARHKRAGDSLVYMQIGRLFDDRKVWTTLVDTLGQLPMGVIVDAGRADYMRGASLPQNFHVSSFVPLGKLADDVELVINSGQSTTSIAAILHGKQLLCIPHSSDSRAFAAKISAKGLGVATRELTREGIERGLESLRRGVYRENVARYRAYFEAHEDHDVLFETMSGVAR